MSQVVTDDSSLYARRILLDLTEIVMLLDWSCQALGFPYFGIDWKFSFLTMAAFVKSLPGWRPCSKPTDIDWTSFSKKHFALKDIIHQSHLSFLSIYDCTDFRLQAVPRVFGCRKSRRKVQSWLNWNGRLVFMSRKRSARRFRVWATNRAAFGVDIGKYRISRMASGLDRDLAVNTSPRPG